MGFQTHLITQSTTPADYERLFPRHAFMEEDQSGFPHIDKAIQINNLALINFFFTEAPQLLNRHDKSNKTFLAKTISPEKLALAERLIVLGADVNIPSAFEQNKEKINLLMEMASIDHLRCTTAWTRLLCYYGYSFNSFDPHKHAPRFLTFLRQVFKSLYIEIASFKQVLINYSPLPYSVTQIAVSYLWQPVYACRNFTDGIAPSVLAESIDDQTTPESFEAMRSLLPPYRFADKDEEGNTVLHYAIQKNNPTLIKYVLGKEPQLLDRPAREGVTFFSYAIQLSGNHPEGARIPKLLLELGADAHAPSASFTGQDMVPLFLTALASDMRATLPITKMDLAARSCTHLLLREGCDADLRRGHELGYDALNLLGMSPGKTSGFGIKWMQTHLFVKMVFEELGREFARERTSLLIVLGTQLLLIDENICHLVVDYLYPKNWSRIPGAENYFKLPLFQTA